MLRYLPRGRSRPRLKPFRIECDWCGKTAIRFYPSRPSVLEKMGPLHRFCSTEHANRHGAWRRRKENAQRRPCARRGCGHVVEPTGAPGRPRLYHDDACKEQARSERARPVADALRAAQARLEQAQARIEGARRDVEPVREALALAEGYTSAMATWRASRAAWLASAPPTPPSGFPVGLVDVPVLELPAAREARVQKAWDRVTEREAMVTALAAWRKGEPKRPPRELHAPVAALQEQLAAFEATLDGAVLALEQATVAVEAVRSKLAKRAADARRRRAPAPPPPAVAPRPVTTWPVPPPPR